MEPMLDDTSQGRTLNFTRVTCSRRPTLKFVTSTIGSCFGLTTLIPMTRSSPPSSPMPRIYFSRNTVTCKKGQISDRPGLLYYVLVRKNKFGHNIYRCLRSNSALEAFHHHIRRASDSCAKHAGPRVQHSRIKKTGFRWNVRALCKAKMIPPIGHYDLHLRDLLCDVARGTPLVAMHVLKGWQRVDQTIKPTVPRGIVEGLLDASLLDKERRQGPSKVPHSKLYAQRWAEETWGTLRLLTFRSAATSRQR